MYRTMGKSRSRKRKRIVSHSFNQVRKRADGNPNTHAFVASPEVTTALAIEGLTFNPLTDRLVNAQGEEVMLSEPKGEELQQKDLMRMLMLLLKDDPILRYCQCIK